MILKDFSKKAIFWMILLILICFLQISVATAAVFAYDDYHINIESNFVFTTTVTPVIEHNLPTGTVLNYQWFKFISENELERIEGANNLSFSSETNITLKLEVTAVVSGRTISGEGYFEISINKYLLLFLNGIGEDAEYNTMLEVIGEETSPLPGEYNDRNIIGWSKVKNSLDADYYPGEKPVFQNSEITNNEVKLYAVYALEEPVVTWLTRTDEILGPTYYTMLIESAHPHAAASFSYKWYKYDDVEQVYKPISYTGNRYTTNDYGFYIAEVILTINGKVRFTKMTDDFNAGANPSHIMRTIFYRDSNENLLYMQKIYQNNSFYVYGNPSVTNKRGYDFIGWGFEKGTAVDYFAGESKRMPNNNLTLYANYNLKAPVLQVNNLNNVPFNADGHNLTATVTHELDENDGLIIEYEWYRLDENSEYQLLSENDSFLFMDGLLYNGTYKLRVGVSHNSFAANAELSDIIVFLNPAAQLKMKYFSTDGLELLYEEVVFEGSDYNLYAVSYERIGYSHAGWALEANKINIQYGLTDTIYGLDSEYNFYAVMKLLKPSLISPIKNVEYEYSGKYVSQSLVADVNIIEGLTYSYKWYKKVGENYEIINNAADKTLHLFGKSDSGVYRVIITVTDGEQSAELICSEINVTIVKKASLLWLYITLGSIGGAAILTGGAFLLYFLMKKRKKNLSKENKEPDKSETVAESAIVLESEATTESEVKIEIEVLDEHEKNADTVSEKQEEKD